jgi:hypothetical protein
MISVTLKVFCLRSNTLSESVFALLKTYLELIFWNSQQDGRGMSLNVGNI